MPFPLEHLEETMSWLCLKHLEKNPQMQPGARTTAERVETGGNGSKRTARGRWGQVAAQRRISGFLRHFSPFRFLFSRFGKKNFVEKMALNPFLVFDSLE